MLNLYDSGVTWALGHQLCDTTGAPAVGAKLSAFAAINVHAGVEASVYLAKGGIDVVVGLNAKYEPEARVWRLTILLPCSVSL